MHYGEILLHTFLTEQVMRQGFLPARLILLMHCGTSESQAGGGSAMSTSNGIENLFPAEFSLFSAF